MIRWVLGKKKIQKNNEKGDEGEIMEFSINALCGSLKSKTIIILGQVKRKRVSILIDSGSTHIFTELRCKVEPTQSVIVIVASRDKLNSTAMCNLLTWTMHGMECQF